MSVTPEGPAMPINCSQNGSNHSRHCKKKNVAGVVLLGRGDEPRIGDAPARGFDSAPLQGSWNTRSRKRNKQKALQASPINIYLGDR